MKSSLVAKLYGREVDDLAVRSKTNRRLYSDRRLINQLDIVNELDGHSGCVNALSWSKSGTLLASGSDDQHLNIHQYNPDASTAQFKLATTVATGHTANIFSVKFMPHSNDRIVVTAAGDAQVRVFDLEYSGQTREASIYSSRASGGQRRRRNIYNDVRCLSDGDTDARVYRSHGDRVKRIVTESSPYLFLTCSEDGEVRQWDLRQPSSFYPPGRPGRFNVGEDRIPPPLISYKRYSLDLNTISCSASQPHYIALGGAHLHAFLHDRRMTGRDRLAEEGKPLPVPGHMTSREEELMNQATQCVRKFAPSGQKKMKRTDNGHITACKISDARPNEMIVSWSGEHIYSFDLVRSAEAEGESTGRHLSSSSGNRTKESRDKKRKRNTDGSEAPQRVVVAARASDESGGPESAESHNTALRVRYQNGQSEDIQIPLEAGWNRSQESLPLTDHQQKAQGIANNLVKVRSSMFKRDSSEENNSNSHFSTALGHATVVLPDMDSLIREWGYPISPSPEMIYLQQSLRRKRESARRFIQASGTLARALGGKLTTVSGTSPAMENFVAIEAKATERQIPKSELFAYDFIKAILLWLESGIGRLVEGFTRPDSIPETVSSAQRRPIPESEASTEAVDDLLIPYLLRLASDEHIPNVEANRFEVDEHTQLFPSEKAAIVSFAAAVHVPFTDLSSEVILAEGADQVQTQDRQTAIRFWGRKVARGLLLNAAEGLDFAFVNQAFGGSSTISVESQAAQVTNDNDTNAIENFEILDQNGNQIDGANADDAATVLQEVRRRNAGTEEDEDAIGELHEPSENNALLEAEQCSSEVISGSDFGNDNGDGHNNDDTDDENNNDEDMDDASSEEDGTDQSSEPDEEDGVPNLGLPRFVYASAFERSQVKEKVESNVPCYSYTRMYRGHCNVKTVKDVNYFGLDDEYVVSGSDDGNFFIWDQKTGELVNVLEGDGEVVNVVQGHPYEPMLAVSGIDHTIKIFSPDARARESARLGSEGVSAHDASEFSSLAWSSRRGQGRAPRRAESTTGQDSDPARTSESTVAARAADESGEDEDYVTDSGLSSRKRMQQSYSITSRNEADRQGGNQDAFLTVRDLQPLLLVMARAGFWHH